VSKICSSGNNQPILAVIKSLQDHYSFWLPTPTNIHHDTPETRYIHPKIPIKTVLSRRQQGFESPTGCQSWIFQTIRMDMQGAHWLLPRAGYVVYALFGFGQLMINC
jgi:hypothetical protein